MPKPPLAPVDTLAECLTELRRWCLRKSSDPHLVDDVIQETALAALQQLGQLRDPGNMRGWLFRIMQRRLAEASRARPTELPLTIDPVAPVPRSPPSAQTRRAIERALRRLPLCLRKPVRLHYLRGWPLKEVAASLDTTVNGVKARLYRARRLLRERTKQRAGGRR